MSVSCCARGGEQALANVLHVAELARSTSSTAACRPRLRRRPAGRRIDRAGSEAPILEEGSDGVRLMTVHKAKGWEFPVVILADITARLTRTKQDGIRCGARRLRASHRRLVPEGPQ